MSFTSGFTEFFEKIRKQTQKKLDKITTEIMKTEDETESFIELTKAFDNNLRTVEENEVLEKAVNYLRNNFMAFEGKKLKEKAAREFSKDKALDSIKYSKMKSLGHNSVVIVKWPTVDMLIEKSERTLEQLRVKKFEWKESGSVIVRLRFTLDDGTTSN